MLFDFFGTLVEYNSSRREQGYHATHALARRLGVEIAYQPFPDRWEDTFTSLDRRNAIDHREYSMAEGVSCLLESVLDRPATSIEIDEVVASRLDEWNRRPLPAGHRGVPRRVGERLPARCADEHARGPVVPDHLTAMGVMASLDAVVTSVELGRRKPHPSTYRAALAALGTTAADTVFVGDTRDTRDADDDGPRGVGMPAFLIDTGGVHDIDESHRLTNVVDLSARLARTNGPGR